MVIEELSWLAASHEKPYLLSCKNLYRNTPKGQKRKPARDCEMQTWQRTGFMSCSFIGLLDSILHDVPKALFVLAIKLSHVSGLLV
jgi:hypothetical protein